jgi:uridine kinase
MDDFYGDEPEEVRLAYNAAEGVRRYFHWERLLEQALLPLRAGVAARYRPFDWKAGHGLGDEVVIGPAAVVIIEGVYSARPELRTFLDLSVLVEAPVATRLRRQRERHDPHDWEHRWDVSERWYFGTVNPRSTYDFVILGERG